MHRFPQGARLNTFAIKSYAQLIIIKARDFLIDQNGTQPIVGIKAIIRVRHQSDAFYIGKSFFI